MLTLSTSSLTNSTYREWNYGTGIKGTRQLSGYMGTQGLPESDPISVEEWNVNMFIENISSIKTIGDYGVGIRSVLWWEPMDEYKGLVLKMWRAGIFNSINYEDAKFDPRKKKQTHSNHIPHDMVYNQAIPVILYCAITSIATDKEDALQQINVVLDRAKSMSMIFNQKQIVFILAMTRKYIETPKLIKGNKIYQWCRYFDACLDKADDILDQAIVCGNELSKVFSIDQKMYCVKADTTYIMPLSSYAVYYCQVIKDYVSRHRIDMACDMTNLLSSGTDVQIAYDDMLSHIAGAASFYTRKKFRVSTKYDSESSILYDMEQNIKIQKNMIIHSRDVVKFMHTIEYLKDKGYVNGVLRHIISRLTVKEVGRLKVLKEDLSNRRINGAAGNRRGRIPNSAVAQ